MSKIGAYNLELQEQANELGFETTQQALDAGCVVEGDCNHPVLVEPLVAAHRAFEREKAEILKELDETLGSSECSPACCIRIERAIKFIEGCHE